MLIVLQAHFEESQFEANRQDGKRFLKWNAIPTLFNVPNKPKPVTLRRVNPLNHKRVFTASMPHDVLDSSSSAKRPRADHQYCRSDTNQKDFQSCGSCDHAYSAGINPRTGICQNVNLNATVADSDLSEPSTIKTNELTEIIEFQSQPAHCTSPCCRSTIARLRLQIRQLQRKVKKIHVYAY